MSVKQMSMVWDLDLDPNHKIVLLAYADHADDDGDNVYPSLGRMAHKTGYSVDQVRRISRQMVNDGLMELVEKGHGRGNPHRYKLTLEKGVRLPSFTAKGNKMETNVRESLRAELLEQNGPVCAICEREGVNTADPDGKVWQIDRIIPARRGGKYKRDNVRLACAHCNQGWKRREEKPSNMPPFNGGPEKVAPDSEKVASGSAKGSNMSLPEPSVRNRPIEPSESTDSSENAKIESLANYHMKRIYDSMKKANYTITGKSKNGNGENEYGRLVSRVQWMLDNMSPTDEELEGLPDSYVRAYTIRGAATDAVYALNELRRQKARDEVMSETKPAAWEPVNPASTAALKAKEKPRSPIWYASFFDVSFDTASRWIDEGLGHTEITRRCEKGVA